MQGRIRKGLLIRIMGKREQDPLVKRFVDNAKRKGAKVHSRWWFAVAVFPDGRRYEISVDEKKAKARP